jgi:crotonobetaine/carnitine-CoA ligase
MSSHPEWFVPRVPAGQECALGRVLRARAAVDPDASFAVFSDGAGWSNRDALALAVEAGRTLAAQGVRPDGRVVLLLPNSAAFIRLFLGATVVGALPVPIHIAMKGALLRQALEQSKPSLIVTHSALADNVRQAWPDTPAPIVEIDRAPAFAPGATPAPGDPVEGYDAVAHGQPEAWSLAALLLTSGTTGGTKAVRIRNGQLWSVARAHYGFLRPDDRIMVTTPLCHIGPLSAVVGAMVQGASMAILPHFKADTFWEELRRHRATAIPGLGASLLHLLNAAPARPDDADNALRIVNVTAVTPEARRFARRFGLSVFASFGMTEISVALVSDLDSDRDGTCGRARDGVEVRIVDEHDLEVTPGEVGEITLRATHPWVLSDGYEDNPQATLAAWRNGWFHTGDLARADADGNVFFVDRLKDVIRRRGENISSVEVEREARAHPHVREAAALGVANGSSDEEVLLVVSALPGVEVDPAELHGFLADRLPHFMTPRYIRVVDELPKTASAKVFKPQLRAQGLAAGTWDRRDARIEVRKQRIGDIR